MAFGEMATSLVPMKYVASGVSGGHHVCGDAECDGSRCERDRAANRHSEQGHLLPRRLPFSVT
jgi:hypothetical protein